MDETLWLLLAAIPLLVLWIRAVLEIARRSDLGRGRQAGWIVVLLVPVVGLAVFFLLRPPPRPPVTTGTGAGTPAELLVVAAERRQRGQIDDAGYRMELADLDLAPSA